MIGFVLPLFAAVAGLLRLARQAVKGAAVALLLYALRRVIVR